MKLLFLLFGSLFTPPAPHYPAEIGNAPAAPDGYQAGLGNARRFDSLARAIPLAINEHELIQLVEAHWDAMVNMPCA